MDALAALKIKRDQRDYTNEPIAGPRLAMGDYTHRERWGV